MLPFSHNLETESLNLHMPTHTDFLKFNSLMGIGVIHGSVVHFEQQIKTCPQSDCQKYFSYAHSAVSKSHEIQSISELILSMLCKPDVDNHRGSFAGLMDFC